MNTSAVKAPAKRPVPEYLLAPVRSQVRGGQSPENPRAVAEKFRAAARLIFTN